MNGTKILGLALAFSAAACSAPDDPDPDRDAGATHAATTDTSAPLPDLSDGVYQGTATDDDASQDATMALWSADTGWEGRIILEESRSFAVNLDDERVLTAVDGACNGCDLDAEWQLDVQSSGGQLRFTVDTDVPSPGFADLVMVPHDGFKPENTPGPGIERWTGHVIAVEPALTDSPILDSDCELLVRLDNDQIEGFYCETADSDSPWLTTVPDSFSRDDDFSFVTESGSTRLGYIGELTRGDRTQRAHGTIHRLDPDAQPTRDAPTIGSFSLEADIP